MVRLKADTPPDQLVTHADLNRIVLSALKVGGIAVFFTVLGFFITQWIGAGNVIFEIKGKQAAIEETIGIILDERRESFEVLFEQNRALMEENKALREELNVIYDKNR